MKRIRILIVVALIGILPVNAQMAVTDPTGMANDISMFIEKMKNSLETTFQIGEQSISVKEMLKISQETMDAITTVSHYVGKVEDLQQFKVAAERSANLLKRGKNVIMNTGYDPEVKLRYIQSLLNMVNRNIQLCTKYIEDFTPGNKNAGNLTDAERTEMKENALEEVETNNEEVEREIDKMEWLEQMIKIYEQKQEMTRNAMFFNF